MCHGVYTCRIDASREGGGKKHKRAGVFFSPVFRVCYVMVTQGKQVWKPPCLFRWMDGWIDRSIGVSWLSLFGHCRIFPDSVFQALFFPVCTTYNVGGRFSKSKNDFILVAKRK